MPDSSILEGRARAGAGHGRGGGDSSTAGRRGDDGRESGVPQRAYVTGIIVALPAILMFFLALVSASVVRKGFSSVGWQPLQVPRIFWLNTLILLTSSVTLVRSRRRLFAHDFAGFRHWWGVSTILGLMFVAGQTIGWRELALAGVYLSGNPNGSFFYLFTAAHAAHLLGGIVALVWVGTRPLHRVSLGTATEVTSLYWHFMDALWIFLFAFLLTSSRA